MVFRLCLAALVTILILNISKEVTSYFSCLEERFQIHADKTRLYLRSEASCILDCSYCQHSHKKARISVLVCGITVLRFSYLSLDLSTRAETHFETVGKFTSCTFAKLPMPCPCSLFDNKIKASCSPHHLLL